MAIIKGGNNQHLMVNLRAAMIAHIKGEPRGNAAARTGPRDDDFGGRKLLDPVFQPFEGEACVIKRGGIRVLGRQAIVDR